MSFRPSYIFFYYHDHKEAWSVKHSNINRQTFQRLLISFYYYAITIPLSLFTHKISIWRQSVYNLNLHLNQMYALYIENTCDYFNCNWIISYSSRLLEWKGGVNNQNKIFYNFKLKFNIIVCLMCSVCKFIEEFRVVL